MHVEREYIIPQWRESGWYALTNTIPCCTKMEQEFEPTANKSYDAQIKFINTVGKIGLEDVGGSATEFSHCPFCGSKITLETTEAKAVWTEEETTEITNPVYKEESVEVPEGV